MDWKELLSGDSIVFLIVLLLTAGMGIKAYQTSQIYHKEYTYNGTVKNMYSTSNEYKGTTTVRNYINVNFDKEREKEILVTKETFDKFHSGQRIAFALEKGRVHPPEVDGIPVMIQMLFCLGGVIAVVMGIMFGCYSIFYLIPYMLMNPGRFFRMRKKADKRNFSDDDDTY